MTPLHTHIQTVCVYPDRARVTRRGRAALEPGRCQLAIGNLPTTIDPASLRAGARGSIPATLLGVDLRREFFKDTPPGRGKEIRDRIQALEDQDRELADQQDSFGKQIEHLDGLSGETRRYATSLARGKSGLRDQAALLDFITEKRLEAQAEIRSLAVQRREIVRELEKLRKELQQIRNTRPRERYTAVIDLDVSRAGELEIELSYTQRGASWQPVYDIRLIDGRLEIAYLGQVGQSTGEDWQDVSLTLSTASPALSAIVPELDPWYIAPRQRLYARAQPVAPSPAAQQVAATAGAAAPPAEDEPVQAKPAAARIEQAGVSVTYQVGDGIDIPGDNSPRKIPIAVFDLPPEFDYLITPKLAEAAFRRVKAENNSPHVLLPGKVQLFDGPEFIGASELERTAPGQELELYFGTDNRIRVERELVRRETDKKLLGDRRRVRYGYEIRLENHTGERQRLTVCDQIPVPRHEDIRVRLESSQPKPNAQDELNRLEWEFSLEAGAEQRIRFDFSVEFPRDMVVKGLP